MNIHKPTIFFALGLSLSLAMTGCGDYFDLKDNPNQVTSPSLNSLLTTATHKTGINNYRIAYTTTYYTQYVASPGTSSPTDIYDDTNPKSSWDGINFALADLHDLAQYAQAQEDYPYLGVAQLLTAYNVGLLADHWGAAPFSDAYGKSQTLTPKYDSEEQLYQSQLEYITLGIENLKKESANTINPSADLIHAGNKEAWIKTGYALQARLLNKISKKASYDPDKVRQAIALSYASNGDEAQMAVFNGISSWANVARDNLNLNLDGWLSDNFINQLNGTTYGVFDPRIEKITDKTIHGTYVGTRNGQGNVGAANTIKDECYISMNSPLTAENAAITLVSYAEVLFMEAEAAFRANDKDAAYEAYRKGIKANMDKLGVAATARDSYLASTVVAQSAAAVTLAQIFMEKYVATYLSPEAWNDVRRNDYSYKNMQLPMNAVLPTFIRRMAYPSQEQSTNGSNVPNVASLAEKLWWDMP